MSIVVPFSIDEIITKLDQESAPIDEHQVSQNLIAARNVLVNPDEAENLGAWAEVLAFALSIGNCGNSPWGTYFRPIASGTREDGSAFYSPGIEGADKETITHWMSRARSITHPVLKARYADLAWDMSRAIARINPDPDMARIAIDAYLQSVAQNLRSDMYNKFSDVLRALDLSLMLRDRVRSDTAKEILLTLHREAVAADEGLWWITFDRLIDDKHVGLSDAEKNQLIADLESIVVQHSDRSSSTIFNPHITEDAAQRLIKHYRKHGRNDDVRRLSEIIGRTFERFASLGDAMLASAVLQTAVNAYRDAGMQEESRRVRVAMEEKIAQSRNQMKSFVIESTILKEDIDKFLEWIIVDNMATTFVRIASEFLQRRSELEKQLREMTRRAPLLASIPQSIIADNHVAARIDSVEDDPLGRMIQQAAQRMDIIDTWLIRALDKAIEVHSITPLHFATWAARTELFDDLTFLIEGVTAWYKQDFIKSVHVLVPQIEVGLRAIVSRLGKPVTKPHPCIAGVSVAIGMGDILYAKDIQAALGDDITLHFRALYADPRGFNLRNDLAHGLLSANRIHLSLASKVIHTLLVLGIWEELAKARKAIDQTMTIP
ncbi:DUF4209 domain-containing protein [Nitrosovibrio sp. Nv17]|uniref:DUF4209 domain-containing protein n=1 Tax=Nitrosovibrio sp. Nv17 TaxID=1855339 RepID=UPI000908A2E8|nr:DUF4209 domain-containing protein [Nitrosovibrio sp. Nv17]SFW14556.1 lysyl-tRNA synthetase, class 1 [Nitrosovibrio sp. Nv17]